LVLAGKMLVFSKTQDIIDIYLKTRKPQTTIEMCHSAFNENIYFEKPDLKAILPEICRSISKQFH